ncbi:hypothetical protein NA57DRAFT_73704 [Rhizodiscina lignyota]|uniref:Uncharacterized protein n=1 Tax=Rhizodiscina lignyota TaxID=1504668 RepID=A0A9P4IIP0_9PEZI|nr:hypothetical protein NA57DRAFT_73704 [Rhizodiscina lignyota]
MGNGLRQSPSRDLTLQKYIQLCTQQDNLRHRLSLTIPSTSPLSPGSPSDEGSFPSSPIRSLNYTASLPSYDYNYHNTISTYLSTSHPTQPLPCPPPSTTAIMSLPTGSDPHGVDEDRLCEVNHQIKATLTELLNHESVRHDDKFRHWVQERLIEAESELRNQRRRSRRRSEVDKDGVVSAIAESFKCGGMGMEGPWRFSTTV